MKHVQSVGQIRTKILQKECTWTYNCVSSRVTHTLLAAGMVYLEGFHNIHFFVSFINLVLGFILVNFSGFYILVLVLVLVLMYQNGDKTNNKT
jgi:hypothetical protein